MSKILIVARTRMGNDRVCIGGHEMAAGFTNMRLLDRKGNSFTKESPFAVSDVWEMRYRRKPGPPPHVEDVCTWDHRRLGQVRDLRTFVLKHADPWVGAPDVLFHGTLHGTKSGSGYVPSQGTKPPGSTGYWMPDADLQRLLVRERTRFRYLGKSAINHFTWVGMAEPPERIAAGSLVRMSLSRIFGSETAPDGYYVQLSGVI